MAGPRVEVLSAPTQDVAKVLAALQITTMSNNVNLKTALSIGQLALKHRQNKSQKQRIIAFVGSPLTETD
jgi:26S proteasome regulatory subunit N10